MSWHLLNFSSYFFETFQNDICTSDRQISSRPSFPAINQKPHFQKFSSNFVFLKVYLCSAFIWIPRFLCFCLKTLLRKDCIPSPKCTKSIKDLNRLWFGSKAKTCCSLQKWLLVISQIKQFTTFYFESEFLILVV